mmetsp:Transcript_2502/g.5501  ORF Transcript_2502/g.5501 Transcript_2502/m.5501 type:complete len:213 (-) Transcript_2502:41-679(-)
MRGHTLTKNRVSLLQVELHQLAGVLPLALSSAAVVVEVGGLACLQSILWCNIVWACPLRRLLRSRTVRLPHMRMCPGDDALNVLICPPTPHLFQQLLEQGLLRMGPYRLTLQLVEEVHPRGALIHVLCPVRRQRSRVHVVRGSHNAARIYARINAQLRQEISNVAVLEMPSLVSALGATHFLLFRRGSDLGVMLGIHHSTSLLLVTACYSTM